VDSLNGMHRIFLGSVGDYGSMMGRFATGYIDNVKLSTGSAVTSAPTNVATVPTTARVTSTTRQTPKPTTPPPAATPTPASPLSPLFTCAALGISACALSYTLQRRKQ